MTGGKGKYNKTSLDEIEDEEDSSECIAPAGSGLGQEVGQEHARNRRSRRSLNGSLSFLLKLQFAFLLLLAGSTAFGFYLLHRQFTQQQERLQEHLINLTLIQHTYNREMTAFANGQFADFFLSDADSEPDSGGGQRHAKSSRSSRSGAAAHNPPQTENEAHFQSHTAARGRPQPQPGASGSGQIHRRKMKRIAPITSLPFHGSSDTQSHGESDLEPEKTAGQPQTGTGYGEPSSSVPIDEDITQHPSNIVQNDSEYVWLTSHSRIPVGPLSITPSCV